MANLKEIMGDFDARSFIGKRAYTTHEPPRIGAIKAIQDHGMYPPSSIPDIGTVFRFKDAQDKGQQKSAWGIYYEYFVNNEIIGVCVFGSWRGNPERVVWSNKTPEFMTTQEQKELNDRIEHARQQSEIKQKENQQIVAKECQEIWNKLPELSSSPYTEKKQIKPYLARSNNGVLTVPVYDNDGLVSLQYIADNSDKSFHLGGKTKGGFLYLKGDVGGFTFITEGYATGCTIREATGCDTYIIFNANNIFEFCTQKKNDLLGKVIIAADDDYKTSGNPGLTKAQRAADSFGFSVVSPQFKDEVNRGTDFNDVHCLYGLDEVKTQLFRGFIDATIEEKNDKLDKKSTIGYAIPEGVISDLYRYYMITSGNNQPGFAMQTALAITSTMLGRYFITDNDNHTSLFFLNVGKTATGKEHCKKVSEHVFRACGLSHLIAGDGFTSGSAVMSLLLSKPVCISIIDEFGRYLEFASDNKGGMQKEANTILMEAIGRPDGVLRAKNYSSMTLTKESADAMQDRLVYCPAITLLALTTPSTFFSNIKMSSVLDGFLNRFVIHISDAERTLRKRTSMIEVPVSIVEWAKRIKKITKDLNSLQLPSEQPIKRTLYFTKEAIEIQQKFEQEMIDLQNELEPKSMDGVPARANEWAMRLSLVLALSRDPDTSDIVAKDIQWACDYMRESVNAMLNEINMSVSENYIEAAKKDVFLLIKQYKKGITWTEMQRSKGFMKYSSKDLKDILQSLMDAEVVEAQNDKTKRGRPSVKYITISGESFV